MFAVCPTRRGRVCACRQRILASERERSRETMANFLMICKLLMNLDSGARGISRRMFDARSDKKMLVSGYKGEKRA